MSASHFAPLRAAAILATFAAFAAPAFASFPPKTFKASQEEIAARCAGLGSRASTTAWDYKSGEYGCVDTRTGFVLICQKANETCKLYYPARRITPKPVSPRVLWASARESGLRGPGCPQATVRRTGA